MGHVILSGELMTTGRPQVRKAVEAGIVRREVYVSNLRATLLPQNTARHLGQLSGQGRPSTLCLPTTNSWPGK